MRPIIRNFYEVVKYCLCHILYYPYILRFRILFKNNSKLLHVGCGKNYFPGWINADLDPRADLIIFLQKKLPFRADLLTRIYLEHVLEHVSFETGVFFLKQVRRVLQPKGVVRIAMPDLDDLIDGYQKDWRRFDWVKWPEFDFIKTRAEMINIAFRWWGHKHLYNREEIERVLLEAGFSEYEFVGYKNSQYDELRDLETRIDSKLIVEAIKD